MKNFTITLSVAIISVSAILAFSFVDNVSENSTSNAKTQLVLEKNLAAAEQKATAKPDSFTAGKAFDNEKRSLDTIEVTVSRGKTYLLTQIRQSPKAT